jgi:hypothetical protein
MKFRLLAVPIVLAGVLSAQGPGPRGHSLTPPTAAEVLQRQVDFLTKFYSLTTAQMGLVTTLVSTEQSCLPTSTAMRTAREGLATAIRTGVSAVPDAVTALNKLQLDQDSCRATAAASIYALLSMDQRMKGIGPLLGAGGRGPGRGPHGGPSPKQ